MSREINLSGGDISVIKALGLTGSPVNGLKLLERLNDMGVAELLDTLDGLMMFDYVVSDVDPIRRKEDLEHANIKVNTTHIRDLREALNPQRKEITPRRQRRG
jgi:hypothetical protein